MRSQRVGNNWSDLAHKPIWAKIYRFIIIPSLRASPLKLSFFNIRVGLHFSMPYWKWRFELLAYNHTLSSHLFVQNTHCDLCVELSLVCQAQLNPSLLSFFIVFQQKNFLKLQVTTKPLFTTLHSCGNAVNPITLSVLKATEKNKAQKSWEVIVTFWNISFYINIP